MPLLEIMGGILVVAALAIVAALIVVSVRNRRKMPTPKHSSGDRFPTQYGAKHQETGTDWRWRPDPPKPE